LFTLPGFNKANVLVKFVVTNDNGNNMYIDNVNLSQSAPNFVGITKVNALQTRVSLYPNPTNGIATIAVTSQKAGDASVVVTNMLGQVVTSKTASLSVGSTTIQFDMSAYAAGIYNVTVNTADGSIIKKLNVTK
jgi:hypothetical protein